MRSLVDTVSAALDEDVVGEARVSGGDTASAFRFELASGRRVFAKTHPSPPVGFFTTEAASLTWLAAADAVAVPAVLAVGDGSRREPAHLVLEWIDEGRAVAGTDEDLGRALARLHRDAPDSFGRSDGRTTGSRGLPNATCRTWAEFYATQRLEPLARIARAEQALAPSVLAALDGLDADRLIEVGGPLEPPARLHGDLWAGNRLVDRAGANWLIDPAAHGGHREFDLAMMRLFGGFGTACFAAYDGAWPLAEGWRARVLLHQIAPLVVHAIKFGGGYRASAAEAIARYS